MTLIEAFIDHFGEDEVRKVLDARNAPTDLLVQFIKNNLHEVPWESVWAMDLAVVFRRRSPVEWSNKLLFEALKKSGLKHWWDDPSGHIMGLSWTPATVSR